VPGDEGEELFPRLAGLKLDRLCDSSRFQHLDQLDAYGRCTQYNRRSYDWDGRFLGYGPDSDISPRFVVPLARRKPSTRLDLAKLINRRLTAMTFGAERWPEIRCDEDPLTEDYAKALVRESRLQSKMLEARDRGGACGTSTVSFKFVDGKPRVTVHDAKHIHVLRWVDRDDYVVGEALKVYRYQRTVWIEGKPKEVNYYFARLWTETAEVVWDPIPEPLARAGTWSAVVPSYRVEHGYGECPLYWTQNLPDSEREDGISDFDGATDTIDGLNMLLSATLKGTIANVDPTLVIKDDPGKNTGVVHKGSGTAIWSKGGAEYLEIQGEAVQAALSEVREIAQMVLDTAGVVLTDPNKATGSAQSAAALKMVYMPMCNQADQLRTQYGDGLLLRVLSGMLRAARSASKTATGAIITTRDGRRIQERPVVILPDRVEVKKSESGETTIRRYKREPGDSEHLTLSWPAYFKATPEDVSNDVKAAKEARGTLVGDETATRYVAHHFGVTDIPGEVAAASEVREADAMLYPGPDGTMAGADDKPGGGGSNNNDDED
jgi:hypothetical protein